MPLVNFASCEAKLTRGSVSPAERMDASAPGEARAARRSGPPRKDAGGRNAPASRVADTSDSRSHQVLLRPHVDEADRAGADAVAGAAHHLCERRAPAAGEPGQSAGSPSLVR